MNVCASSVCPVVPQGPERLAEAERSVLFAEFVEVWGRFYANDEVREARFKTFEVSLPLRLTLLRDKKTALYTQARIGVL